MSDNGGGLFAAILTVMFLCGLMVLLLAATPLFIAALVGWLVIDLLAHA